MKKVLLETHFDIAIADNETLGRWHNAVVLSTAITHGDLRKPYTIEELVEERTFFQKFDVKEQTQLGREIEGNTVQWWKSERVTDEARKMSLFPDKERDTSIRTFVSSYESWAHRLGFEPTNTIHGDRNLFDVSKLQHIIEMTLGEKHHPWSYHDIIDITSFLKAWTGDRYGGIDIRKLEGAVYHDPRWDAAVDWYRMQQAAVKIGILELES